MEESPVTSILERASAGDGRAASELLPLVYEQLRMAAQRALNAERSDHTLQATALVHEVYVRLVGSQPIAFNSRAHFYFAAARAMQQLLIEHARRRGRVKRGGIDGSPARRVALDFADLADHAEESEILALDQAVRHLDERDPDAAAVVRLRFFAGLTGEQDR